jgi:hypothetical protein
MTPVQARGDIERNLRIMSSVKAVPLKVDGKMVDIEFHKIAGPDGYTDDMLVRIGDALGMDIGPTLRAKGRALTAGALCDCLIKKAVEDGTIKDEPTT